MMPMRANIIGPPDLATRINASIAACHSWASCSAFGSVVMYLPASSRVTSWRPRGNGIGSSNRRCQRRLLMAPALLVEFDFRAFRHPWCHIVVDRVSTRTRGRGGATAAGVLAFPWSVRMALAHAVLTKGAFHSQNIAELGIRGTIIMRVYIIVASLALSVVGRARGTVVDTGADAQRYCELLV